MDILSLDSSDSNASLKKCHDCGRLLDVSEFIPRQKSRTTLTFACRSCRDKNTKRINPEKNRAKTKTWLEDPTNKEKALQRSKDWHQDNPERDSANHLGWKTKNHARYLQNFRNAKARRKKALGHSTAGQVAARVAMWGGMCWMCGAPWEQIDHVIPLSRGGTNWPANLRPACAQCNNRKNGNGHRAYVFKNYHGK